MNLSVILAHPDPDSLNHALARTVASALEDRGHQVTTHDLYAEGFDPRLGTLEIAEHRSDDPLVERHASELARADGLVVVHPNWFDLPPAVLKGWVDRVVREGTAFTRSEGGFQGRLRAAAALLVTTANASYDAETGDRLDDFWRGIVFAACGVPRVERVHCTPVIASTLETRRAWLTEAAERAGTLFGRA